MKNNVSDILKQDDIPMKLTYSKQEIEEKKQKYLKLKNLMINQLDLLKSILVEAGEEPLSGENRKIFFAKFNSLDRNMIGEFDQLSFNYFEAKESPEEE